MFLSSVSSEIPVKTNSGLSHVGLTDDLSITFRLVDDSGNNHFIEMSVNQAREVVSALSTLINVNVSIQAAVVQSKMASLQDSILSSSIAGEGEVKENMVEKEKVGFRP